MRYTLLLLLSVLFLACNSDDAADATTSGLADKTSMLAPGVTPTPATQTDGELTTSTFTAFPDIIDGCDCTLRLDPQPGGEDELFFVFNWQEGPGVIGINGQEVTVERGASMKLPDDKMDGYLHENDRYRIQTTLSNEGEAGDEGSYFSGTIKVTDKVSGTKIRARVSGTCSC